MALSRLRTDSARVSETLKTAKSLRTETFLSNRILAAQLDFLQRISTLSPDEVEVVRDRLTQLWRVLRPREVKKFELIRLGSENDGGYILLDDFEGVSSVLSLGVGESNDIDFHFASALGKPVFAYDHTVDCLPRDHPLISFRRIGVGSGAGLMPLSQIMKVEPLGAEGILLCDIEGAELSPSFYQAADFARFRMISLELHGLHGLLGRDFANHVFELLNAICETHQTIHLHVNNYDALSSFAGLPLPQTLEITLVRRADYSFGGPITDFPRALDAPNSALLPERAWSLPAAEK